MRNRRIALLLTGSLIAMSAWSQEPITNQRTRPPEKLKRVQHPEPHFTPYEPPTAEELGEDATIHIIVKGDTLWDLAASQLGTPYYWPQIWEANRYISDPRWIYPGDPLVIPRPLAIAEIQPVPPEDFMLDLSKLPSPEPAAKYVDVYCSTAVLVDDVPQLPTGRPLSPSVAEIRQTADGDYVTGATGELSPWEPAAGTRVGTPDLGATSYARPEDPATFLYGPPRIVETESQGDKVTLATGEVAYINRGSSDGVKAGDEFYALRRGRDVYHPKTLAFVGVAVMRLGRLKVLCTQEKTSTVEIIETCAPMQIGDFVRPFEPIPIPLVSDYHPTPEHCSTDTAKLTGTIIFNRDDRLVVATEEVMNVDLGSEAGLAPGDFLVVYRPHPAGPLFPGRILGDAVVLMVNRTTATTKIVYANDVIRRGDLVALR